jgi:hypothetical protein
MLARQIVLSAAACLVAAALFAEEPECAANYKSDSSSAETSVLTSLTPQAVIERLPRKLNAAGATMEWAEPEKGTLKAGSLSVKAAADGSVTRVTFHASPAADKTTLCRYAGLVGDPPKPPEQIPPQDPALIATMKDDLLKRHQIIEPVIGKGLNNAAFRSLEDFLEFTITRITDLPDGKREYFASLLLPRDACGIASEDLDDGSLILNGHTAARRTKPVRAEVTLIYAKDGAGWKLGDAFIRHIESVK